MRNSRLPRSQTHSEETSSEQAYLPAEQPAARQDPWLPPAHVDPCGSGGSRGTSPQGPRAHLRLVSGVPVLPSGNRLRRSQDFKTAVRRGYRVGRRSLVVYLYADHDSGPPGDEGKPLTRAGFIVGKTVGSAVKRQLVRRRLRELVRHRLDQLPQGSLLVVRVQPGAAMTSFTALADDLDQALCRLLSMNPGWGCRG